MVVGRVYSAAYFNHLLPGWKIEGSDISRIAIQKAKERNPKLNFFHHYENQKDIKKYNLIFTHHVLEHVSDLELVCQLFRELLSIQGMMIHILPCGNEGSLEWKLCNSRVDGIEVGNNNRFFFEEEGHLRRLKTSELSNILLRYNFHLEQECYMGHFWEMINWVRRCDFEFIEMMFCASRYRSNFHKLRACLLKKVILFFKTCLGEKTLCAYYYRWNYLKRMKKKTLKVYVAILLFFPLFVLGFFIWCYKNFKGQICEYLAFREWEKKKYFKSGSEMFLFYRKDKDT